MNPPVSIQLLVGVCRSSMQVVSEHPEASLFSKAAFNVMDLSELPGMSLADAYLCLCFKVTEVGVIGGEEKKVRRQCRVSSIDGTTATGYLLAMRCNCGPLCLGFWRVDSQVARSRIFRTCRHTHIYIVYSSLRYVDTKKRPYIYRISSIFTIDRYT